MKILSVVIVISVFEYYSGKELIYFFLIVGLVFFPGTIIQIFLSKRIFKKLESLEVTEETINAQLIDLRCSSVAFSFSKKYYAIFKDEEGIEKEYKISRYDFENLKKGSYGELTRRENLFAGFKPF